jgi:heptosyltransferase-2
MNILFVKIGAIGDALMARGLPKEAKLRYPGCRFSWMAGRGIAPLVRLFEGVDDVLEVDEAALFKGGWAARAAALVRAAAAAGLRRRDLVLTGHSDGRYRLLTAATPARWRRSFREMPPKPGRYHGHEYVRLLTGEEEVGRIPLFAPLRGPGLSEALRSELSGKGRALLLFPGGARNAMRDDPLRRWPLANYRELARKASEAGWRIWLGGGVQDKGVRQDFVEVPHTDLIGRLSLPETLDLCATADAVVTHDSGPLHLAQAAGARTVALFGPTQPSTRLDPASAGVALWGGAGLSCRPCYDGREYARCGDNVCLSRVSAGDVLAVLG